MKPTFLTYGLKGALRFLVVILLSLGVALTGLTLIGYADETATTAEIDPDNAVNTQQIPDSSFIYDTSIYDLSNASSYYDGQTVQITGEVIGDKISADIGSGYYWIVLSSLDDSSTINVYITAESAAKIDTYGDYDSQGTTLQVQGVYNLACSEHDGLSDLHAEIVTVVESGRDVSDEFEAWRFVPGLIAIGIGLFLLALFYWLRERRR